MKIFKTSMFLILCICFKLTTDAIAEVKNWNKFGSSWEFKNSKVSTIKTQPNFWGYYELTNYNTLLSIKNYNNYSLIEISSEIFDREKTPSEFMISFNVINESQDWCYHMYAFKLTGGFWGIDKASFIYSDRLDKLKPFTTKNNIFVNELATADCKVKYDKMYLYRVAFEGENVTLYINDEKILSASFPEKNHDGRIAVSARNVKIAIDKVVVKKDGKTVFQDDFNEDTILIKKMMVEKIPANDADKVQQKKP
jgi:hypothetical protein